MEGGERTRDSRRRRRRTANACDRCRRHKIKCSGTQPCETCIRRRHGCVFIGKQRFSQSYVRELQRRVAAAEQRDNIDESIVGPSTEQPIFPSPDSHTEATTERRSSRPSTRSRPSTSNVDTPTVASVDWIAVPPVGVQLPHPPQPSDPPSPERCSSTEAPTLINHLAMGKSYYVPDNTGKAIYLGTSSNWSYGRRVLMLAQERIVREPLPPQDLLWEGRAYDLGWYGERSTEFLPRFNGAVLPQADFGIYLVNAVKFYVGQLFHLFDEADFMGKFSQFYDRPSEQKAPNSLWYNHYLLVLAFGKAFTAREHRDCQKPPGKALAEPWKACDEVDAIIGNAFFLQAISTMPDLAFANVDPLEAVEVLCCAAIYLQSLDFRGAAFRMIGQALRYCQDNGFHTEMQHCYVSEVRVERARRCFWTVLLLDRQMSALMGVPVTTRDEDISAKLPSFGGSAVRLAALRINVDLSSIVVATVLNVYGKEGRLNSKFLVHTKAALKSIAKVTNELNQSFPLPTDVTGAGISRVAAYLHLLHHQCIILATRPVLFNYFDVSLPGASRPLRPVYQSESISALLQMCKESALQMLRILLLLQGQGLLECFLPFDLDATYTAATVLLMAAHIDQPLVEDERPWVQMAFGFLEEMAIRGNRIAAISKADLARLKAILDQHPQQNHLSTRRSSHQNVTNPNNARDDVNTSSATAEIDSSFDDTVDGLTDWLGGDLTWQESLDAERMTSVADAIDLDGMSWWFDQNPLSTSDAM